MNLDDVDRHRFRAALAGGQGYALLALKAKITWRCNLSCVMCSYWTRTGLPELSTAQWETVIDEAAALGCRKIHFSGGEVLLRPDLEMLVARAAQHGLRVNLTTNGTLLAADRARALVGAGVSTVTVSLDSPERKVHDKIRGEGAWRAAVHGAKILRRAAKQEHAKLHLRLNVVISRKTYRALDGLPDLAADLGVRAVLLIPVDDVAEKSLRLSRRQIVAYSDRYPAAWASEPADLAPRRRSCRAPEAAEILPTYPFGRTPVEQSLAARGLYALGEYDRAPCLIPWVHSFLLPDGTVYPCCMRHQAGPCLGDVRAAPLSVIWQGAAYAALRRGLLEASSREPCTRCDDFISENRALRHLAGLAPQPAAGSPASEAAPTDPAPGHVTWAEKHRP